MSKIVNRITAYLEEQGAEEVANQMIAKKRGKDNDATPQQIEKALTDAGLDVKANYATVAKRLEKQGFKVWKKLKKGERYQREQDEGVYICSKCGYETEKPGTCPNCKEKLHAAAEEKGD